MKQVINISDAPKPIAPYSQACLAQGMLFVSGQIPVDPQTGKLAEGDTRGQTKQVMENIKKILKEANMELSHVVKCTLFMSDLALFKDINEVYGSYFSQDPPAREAVQVSAIPMNAALMISCIAAE